MFIAEAILDEKRLGSFARARSSKYEGNLRLLKRKVKLVYSQFHQKKLNIKFKNLILIFFLFLVQPHIIEEDEKDITDQFLQFKSLYYNKNAMSKLELSQVLGSSTSKPQHISFAQDCLLYISGSFIIFYNPIVDEQICYLQHSSPLISALCVSPCQEYLAISSTINTFQKEKTIDSNVSKKNNIITIYKLGQVGIVTPEILITLKGHKYEIDHLVFSTDSKYIVSISNKDGSMFSWDCKSGQRLTQNKNSKNINSIKILNQREFQNNSKKDFGVYLVTTGRGNCKIWTFMASESAPISRIKEEEHWILSGKTISLSKKFATKQFIDVCFWQKYILLLTSDGLLCFILRSEKQDKLEKCIDLMITKTTSMDIHFNTVICGGDSALIKVIDLQNLSLLRKFPKPPPNKKQNISKDEQEENIMISYDDSQQFSQCLGIKTIGSNKFSQFIITLYSNFTIFIWRPQPNDIIAMRSIITHSSSINSVTILQQFKNDLTFFGTISEDKTLRIWHIYKKCIYNRESIDIGEIIGIKRNAYCRNLTRIIYMQSEKQVTSLSGFREKSVACLAHRQFIIYSLETFQVICHQLLEWDAVALQIKDEVAYIALQNGKILIYQIIEMEDRLHKIRQIQFDNKIRKMKIVDDSNSKYQQTFLLLLTSETQQAIIYSLKKSKVVFIEKSVKDCCLTGHNILFAKGDHTIWIFNTHKLKCSNLISLKHEITDFTQSIKMISCNMIWVVLTTTNNRLIICNFTPAVVCSQSFSQNINGLAVSDNGQIILVGDYGDILIFRMQSNYGYVGMQQQLKKWIEKNDMSWIDGSVWAQRKLSDSEKRDRHIGGSIVDSIKLKSSELKNSLYDKGSIKMELPNINIAYKKDQNDQSIFNPSDILQQAKNIYKQIEVIESKNNSNINNQKNQTKREDEQDIEDVKISARLSRPPINESQKSRENGKKRIFGFQSKKTDKNQQMQNQYGLPAQFRNNLVNSVIHTVSPEGRKLEQVTSNQKKIAKESQKSLSISQESGFNKFQELSASKQQNHQIIRETGEITKMFEDSQNEDAEIQRKYLEKLEQMLESEAFKSRNHEVLKRIRDKIGTSIEGDLVERGDVLRKFAQFSEQFVRSIETLSLMKR